MPSQNNNPQTTKFKNINLTKKYGAVLKSGRRGTPAKGVGVKAREGSNPSSSAK